jgi:opacity protein-like surface antigen
MKKFLFLAALAVGLFASPAHAEYRSESYVRGTAGTAKFFFNGITASTSALVVDLSSASTGGLYPHSNTAELDVVAIRVQIDKVAASSATVQLGVITAVNATNGNFTAFYSKSFNNDTVSTTLEDEVNPFPAVWRLKVNGDGKTPFLGSNLTSLSDTAYQTDVTLPATSGTPTFPAVGDLILRVVMVGVPTAMNITVEVNYYSER